MISIRSLLDELKKDVKIGPFIGWYSAYGCLYIDLLSNIQIVFADIRVSGYLYWPEYDKWGIKFGSYHIFVAPIRSGGFLCNRCGRRIREGDYRKVQLDGIFSNCKVDACIHCAGG